MPQVAQQDETVLQAAVTARARYRVGGMRQRLERVTAVLDAERYDLRTQSRRDR